MQKILKSKKYFKEKALTIFILTYKVRTYLQAVTTVTTVNGVVYSNSFLLQVFCKLK